MSDSLGLCNLEIYLSTAWGIADRGGAYGQGLAPTTCVRNAISQFTPWAHFQDTCI